jgi:tetratricopeptide (TPR) repeat protein
MQFRQLSAIFLVFLISFAVSGVAPTKSELESMYDKAFRAFDSANYDEALAALDAIDTRQPDLAESLNLRGVVYMRQGKYDRAEATLRKVLSIDPKFWNAGFNLAEISFLKKDWVEARNRFEVLIARENEGMQSEMSQLIQYKILLTFVLQGKENMVDWILNQFELAKGSPALYYSNAAIALQHGNQKEATEWMSAAKKHFAAPLNELFAESFYEIGWLQRPAGKPRAALEITSAAERAERLKTEAKVNFEKAERAFEQRDIDAAVKFLDLAEAAVPNDAASDNLRGEILMDQGRFDEAEVVLRRAFTANPKFREAQYNLAQIPFKRGEYAKSRDRFEALFAETPGDDLNQAAQLIKFKIFLTFLLENRESEARQLMDQFTFTGDSPALYYAQSAWEFEHGNADRGSDWIASAQKIYSPALNLVFADSLYDVGWLKRPAGKTPSLEATLEQAASPPATEAKPAMRLGLAGPLPGTMGAAGTMGNSPTGHTTQAVPSKAQTASIPTALATPVLAPSPPDAARLNPASAKLSSTPLAKSPVSVSAASANAPVVTVLGRIRQWLQPVFAEMSDDLPSPRTLLVGVLLVAGILLLVWTVVQFLHRNLPPGLIQGSPVPLTEPPLSGDISQAGSEQKISNNLLNYGPPKLSLQLQARETAVDPTALPLLAANDDALGVQELLNDVRETNSEAVEEIASGAPFYSETAAREEERAAVEQEVISEISLPHDSEEISRAAGEPSALAIDSEILTEIEIPPAIAETTWRVTDLEKRQETAQSTIADLASLGEELTAPDESVGQGQPIPQLMASPFTEPALSEPAQPEAEFTAGSASPEAVTAETTASRDAAQSGAEPLSFPPRITSTEPISPQPTTPTIMQEMTITPSPAAQAFSSTMPTQRPAGAMQTAVQLTFSMEIGSMQLTPTFEMRDLQLRPTSRVVTMRLAPSQAPHPPLDLQITFEIVKIELEGETISTVRLVPSGQEKPTVISSSSFAVARFELEPNSGIASVQLTPSHQGGASVHLTAGFQISAIEFSPGFGIAAIVLNSTSRNVSLQLPGAEPTIEDAPVFAVEKVEMNGSQLGLIQVTQLSSGHL